MCFPFILNISLFFKLQSCALLLSFLFLSLRVWTRSSASHLRSSDTRLFFCNFQVFLFFFWNQSITLFCWFVCLNLFSFLHMCFQLIAFVIRKSCCCRFHSSSLCTKGVLVCVCECGVFVCSILFVLLVILSFLFRSLWEITSHSGSTFLCSRLCFVCVCLLLVEFTMFREKNSSLNSRLDSRVCVYVRFHKHTRTRFLRVTLFYLSSLCKEG